MFISLLLSSTSIFSAELLCDFEKDQCNFEVSTDVEGFEWKRYNSKQLMENDKPSPPGDFEGKDTKFFMVTTLVLDENEGAVTELKSPLFKSNEHVFECFQFWFYFGVSFISGLPTNLVKINGQFCPRIRWVVGQFITSISDSTIPFHY